MTRIDTNVWRQADRLVAVVMHLQAWTYHKAGQGGNGRTTRAAIFLSKVLLRLGSFLINASQVLLGRWQQESDLIVS